MRSAGVQERRITLMWASLTLVCGFASVAGYLVADTGSHTGESPAPSPAEPC